MRSALAAILLFILAAGAQPPQPQAPKPQQAPAPPPAQANAPVKFQSTTQLVVEIVTVKDKSGKVIEGLTAKDFTITEAGAPQTVAFCEFQKLEDEKPQILEPKPAAPAAPKAAAVAPVTQSQIVPERPGDIRYRNRRLLALYFDMTSMPPPDQLRALSAAQKFVKTQMQKADLMALLEYAGGAVKVLHDFSDDRDDLLATIDKLVVGEGQGFDLFDSSDAAADTGTAFGQDDSEFNIFNTDRQLAALQTAANLLGQLNEKKMLIYFASGLQLNGVDNQAQLQATVNSAIRANVAFYPIDARGLMAQAPLGDATRGSPGGLGMYNGGAAMASMGSFQRSQDTLYAIAADTGGKALLDYNDLTKGIVDAEQAISSYYIIGYYTTNGALDGKYRKINITVGDTSAKLDFRHGYFAGKQFNKFTVADKERQLEDALMLLDPITDLTIAMEVDYFQLNRAEYFVPLVAKIPGSELALAKHGGAEHTLIDFIGEVKDEYNVTVQNVRDKVDIKLTGETASQLSKHPIEYDTGFTLLPGTYKVKFLARDDETGRIGTYMHTFTIPNLNKEDKRIPISSVVLSSQRMDLKDAIYTAKDKTQAAQAANPLVQDNQKLIPSVTRVFSKARDMYIYLQAYQPTAQTTQPLVAFVSFYRGQVKAFETAPLPVTEANSSRLKTIPLRFSLALDKLPAGKYDCQVTVVDPTNQKAAFWQTPVMLVP